MVRNRRLFQQAVATPKHACCNQGHHHAGGECPSPKGGGPTGSLSCSSHTPDPPQDSRLDSQQRFGGICRQRLVQDSVQLVPFFSRHGGVLPLPLTSASISPWHAECGVGRYPPGFPSPPRFLASSTLPARTTPKGGAVPRAILPSVDEPLQ